MNKRDLGKYYQEVKKELSEKVSNAERLLDKSEETFEEIERNRKQSSQTLSDLRDSYTKAVNLINETQQDLQEITTLRKNALDPTTGIKSIITKVESLSEKSESLNQKIETAHDEAENFVNEIHDNLTESEDSIEEIRKNNQESEELKESIISTYQIAVDVGLAGAFDKRRISVKDNFVDKWERRFNISLSVVAIVAVVVLFTSFFFEGIGFSLITLFRLSLLSPLIFFTGYCGVQYGRERRLLEKYAFKSVSANSLDSYTRLLTDKFQPLDTKEKKTVIDFVVETMKSIYALPHEEARKRTYKVGADSKFASLSAELKEEVSKQVESAIKEKTVNGSS